jgi:hypothetical protein
VEAVAIPRTRQSTPDYTLTSITILTTTSIILTRSSRQLNTFTISSAVTTLTLKTLHHFYCPWIMIIGLTMSNSHRSNINNNSNRESLHRSQQQGRDESEK